MRGGREERDGMGKERERERRRREGKVMEEREREREEKKGEKCSIVHLVAPGTPPTWPL